MNSINFINVSYTIGGLRLPMVHFESKKNKTILIGVN